MRGCRALDTVVIRLRGDQPGPGKDDCAFSGIFKVYRGAAAGDRLYLSHPPIRLPRKADEISRNEVLGHAD